MATLFDHEMALALPDYSPRKPGEVSPWCVCWFDRHGRWQATRHGITKSWAIKTAARERRWARRRQKEDDDGD